jgi:hypothetical protein
MGWDTCSKESRSFSYVKLKLKMKTVEIVGRLMTIGSPPKMSSSPSGRVMALGSRTVPGAGTRNTNHADIYAEVLCQL